MSAASNIGYDPFPTSASSASVLVLGGFRYSSPATDCDDIVRFIIPDPPKVVSPRSLKSKWLEKQKARKGWKI